ncbi:hypothetical protein B0H13DRAFT_2375697 [Mycena leptocephala]|nr:hypothetical protein B0H13DRAFT_2375697 [Mycena leptocephala]
MSYSMGENIQTAAIYHRSPAPGKRLHKYKFSVIDLGIAHDFATRPTVTQVFVKPKVDFGGRTGLSGAFCVRLLARVVLIFLTMSPPSSQAKATNARSVTVLDVLQAILAIRACRCLVIDSPVLTLRSTNDVTDDMVDLALQGAFTPDGRRRGKWLNKADCLEGFRRYEGLEATRDGFRVNAVARLSSQPVAGEFFGPKRGSES